MAVQKDVPNPLVHKVEMNSGNETRKAKSKIDEIFEEREERAAKRFSAAELEKMAIESENEVARMRGEPPKYKYGGEIMESEKKEEEARRAEQREKMTTSAKALIDSGLDPALVGQMLTGLSGAIGVTPAVAPAQGMGFDDVLKFVTMIIGNKETDELKRVIANLDKKIEDLARGDGKKDDTKPLDPVAFARQQAEAVTAWNKAIKELMPEVNTATATGEPLEVVKEHNRHSEKMEEIKSDTDYKRNLTNIATDIPERIGRGIAGQFSEDEGSAGARGNGAGNELETITCGCGQIIQITPETGNTITCPNPECKAVFEKGATEIIQE